MTIEKIKSELLRGSKDGLTPDEKMDVTEMILSLSLSEQDEFLSDLDDIVEIDIPPSVPSYKIWRFTTAKNPLEINYKTSLNIRLHPKTVFDRGELVEVNYFHGYDGVTFTDKVLSVYIEWIRNDGGVLIERRETRKWVLDDDSDYGPDVKVTSKIYTPQLAAIADSRRRENITNDILSMAGQFGLKEQAGQVFLKYDDIISAYIKTGDKSIIQLFSSAPEEWLDAEVPGRDGQTLRQLIIWNLNV